MFNPHLPEGVQIFAFTPDWTHAADYQTNPTVQP
jgi:hypothetical protein